MEDWGADLPPCNFATIHFPAERSSFITLQLRDHPFDGLLSEFLSPLNFATDETEDLSQRPSSKTVSQTARFAKQSVGISCVLQHLAGLFRKVVRHHFFLRMFFLCNLGSQGACSPRALRRPFRIVTIVAQCSATSANVVATPRCSATPSQRQLDMRHPGSWRATGATGSFRAGVVRYRCHTWKAPGIWGNLLRHVWRDTCSATRVARQGVPAHVCNYGCDPRTSRS